MGSLRRFETPLLGLPMSTVFAVDLGSDLKGTHGPLRRLRSPVWCILDMLDSQCPGLQNWSLPTSGTIGWRKGEKAFRSSCGPSLFLSLRCSRHLKLCQSYARVMRESLDIIAGPKIPEVILPFHHRLVRTWKD